MPLNKETNQLTNQPNQSNINNLQAILWFLVFHYGTNNL